MDRRYPIGEFTAPPVIDAARREAWIGELERFPGELREEVSGLDDGTLARRYREGGWTLRQVVHHVADSHSNAAVRCKWTLTEDRPTIKAYDEKAWAELADTREAPTALALDVIDSVHRRWVYLLRSVSESDWERAFFHPESEAWVTLAQQAGIYSWHGRHHLEHIRLAKRDPAG